MGVSYFSGTGTRAGESLSSRAVNPCRFDNTRVLVERNEKHAVYLSSGVVPAVRQLLWEDKTLLPFFRTLGDRAAGGAGALLTGCCAILNPASGHTAIITTVKRHSPLWTAQWCCAGTATTSCVTRPPNHLSNLLTKTCQHG